MSLNKAKALNDYVIAFAEYGKVSAFAKPSAQFVSILSREIHEECTYVPPREILPLDAARELRDFLNEVLSEKG